MTVSVLSAVFLSPNMISLVLAVCLRSLCLCLSCGCLNGGLNETDALRRPAWVFVCYFEPHRINLIASDSVLFCIYFEDEFYS